MLTVTNHSEIINHMINIASLAVLTEFLNSTNPETVKLTLFAIANISTDNEYSASAVLKDEALIFRLLHLLINKLESVRKETCWAILSALYKASSDDLRAFHNLYGKEYINRLLSCLEEFKKHEPNLIIMFLDAFEKLFTLETYCYDSRLGHDFGSFKYYFSQLNGEEVLEQIQFNCNEEIYLKAHNLIEKYFK